MNICGTATPAGRRYQRRVLVTMVCRRGAMLDILLGLVINGYWHYIRD